MRKVKELNNIVREYNGLVAKHIKLPSRENKALVDECLLKLKAEVDKILP